MGQARVHLIISGRVQGVAFRYSAKDEADQLGVFGWVRNRRDGTVEVTAEGERAQLEDLVAWCRQGPPLARVREVKVDWEERQGEFTQFSLAHTV
jgi:acylphosphatase